MAHSFPRPELLCPAGSMEAVRAAVASGADAVYMAGTRFNARRNAKNLTEDELREAIAYCRERGVRTHITVNILFCDRELPEVVSYAESLAAMGADALIVADIGAAALIHARLPDLELHASTQMTLSTAEAVQAAADLGFSRAVLARELSLEDIRSVRAASPIEIEVFAHGALCMCWSGQCYLSSLIGRRSGNRGLCAQPCRLPYGVEGAPGASAYPLSLRDLCAAKLLSDLRDAGVASLKLEGRMKSPGYVACVTRIYADCLREDRPPTEAEQAELFAAFNREGFTSGYLENARGREMFGHRPEDAPPPPEFVLREGHEPGRVPVGLALSARPGLPVTLTVSDGEREIALSGEIPEEALRPADPERISEALAMTGGTPYVPAVSLDISPRVYLPLSEVKRLRREALSRLSEQRRCPPAHRVAAPLPPVEPAPPLPCRWTVQAERPEQVGAEVLALSPARVCLPLEICEDPATAELLGRLPEDCLPVVTLPPVARPGDMAEIRRLLSAARAAGFRGALCGNLGFCRLVTDAGLSLCGDLGLNVFNSRTAEVLSRLSFTSAALSFELPLGALRTLRSPIPGEAVVYGRLPAMVTENCPLSNAGVCGTCGKAGLTDRTGARFPVLRAFGCRARILNAHTLWLADKTDDLRRAGLSYLRLCFTTESPEECSRVAQCYQAGGGTPPDPFTRGLYYRSLE